MGNIWETLLLSSLFERLPCCQGCNPCSQGAHEPGGETEKQAVRRGFRKSCGGWGVKAEMGT